MRAFIAVDMPDSVSDYLRSIQIKGCKYKMPVSYHLTLRFFDDMPKDIPHKLSAFRYEPFKANLSGIGAFPSKRNPNVLWCGLEPYEKISWLKSDLDRQLNLRPDRFHAHVTIARIRSVTDRYELEKVFDKMPSLELDIRHIVLYESTLTSAGPIYNKLASTR